MFKLKYLDGVHCQVPYLMCDLLKKPIISDIFKKDHFYNDNEACKYILIHLLGIKQVAFLYRNQYLYVEDS